MISFDKNLIKAIIKGLATFFPGYVYFLRKRRKKRKNSCSNSEFCYSFWLRMIVHCHEQNVDVNFNHVGEIGTAGSFGLGTCALLTGSKRYYALDIENIYDINNNLRLFDEIVNLFKNKTPIPSKLENINLIISDYSFPENYISPLYLNENYVAILRSDLINCLSNYHSNFFFVKQQWQLSEKLNIDFLFSRAVMEHVLNADEIYLSIYNHLKPEGYMLHDIELHSHSITIDPFGHYNLNRFVWFLIFGKRDYLLNRWNIEMHLKSIERKYKLICVTKNYKCLENNCNDSSDNILPYGASILAKKKKV